VPEASPRQTEFDASLVEPLWRSTFLLAVLSLVASVSFLVIDALMGRFSVPLLALRIGAFSAFSALLIAFYRERSRSGVLAFAFTVYLIDMGATCVLILLTGGIQSDWYAGLYIVELTPPVFFTYRPRVSLWLGVSLLLPAIATTVASGRDPSVVIRVASLVLIGIFGYFVGRLAYRLRQRDFDAAASLRDTQEELQRTHSQLVHAEKLSTLGTLSACIAHEVSQPLTALVGYMNLITRRLENRDPSPEELVAVAHTVQMMTSATERMTALVDHLRDYGRRSGGAAVSTSLNDVAQGATLFIQGEVAKRGVELTLRLASPSPQVLADPMELEQVVLNLLLNARDALAESPERRVIVETRIEDDHAVLEVRDSGPGVPEVARRRIFEPFFTTKPVGVGTGLGLPVSREIVRRHGGELAVGDAPEGGACFRMLLPLEAEVAAPGASPLIAAAEFASEEDKVAERPPP
jgi:signal transduction histidine kinase